MDAQQRAEIVSHARKTIVNLGVKALRMDDIAHATHVSKRTLYETFGDKEELLFLAAQEHFDVFDQSNFKAVEHAPNILVAMIIIMEEVRKNAEINWNLRRTLKLFYPKVNERLWNHKADEKRKFVSNSIITAISEGYIRQDIDVELTINIFNYIAIGISSNNEMLKIPSHITPDYAFQEVLVTYIRGISTQMGVRTIDEYLEQRAN